MRQKKRAKVRHSAEQQTDIQRAILRAIAAQSPDGLNTRYKLAVRCGWKPSAIYPMLSGRTSVQNIQKMCDVLGLTATQQRRQHDA